MSYCSNADRETLLIEVDKRNKTIYALENKVQILEGKAIATGLTTEELQGIHGLIQKQIELIKDAQESASKNALSSGVSDLLKLVSLVSKPTD